VEVRGREARVGGEAGDWQAGGTEAGVEHHTVQVWTASGYWRFEASGSPLAGGQAALSPELRAAEPHDFGRIPFCVLRNDPDWTADFWGRPEAPNMVPGNEEINRLVTDAITNWFFTTSEVANGNLRAAGVGDEQAALHARLLPAALRACRWILSMSSANGVSSCATTCSPLRVLNVTGATSATKSPSRTA
jgi:hypothetical protein